MLLTLPQVLLTFGQFGYHVNTRPFELNLVGVRSPVRTAGNFDDEILAFWRDAANKWQCFACPATTDPSDYYLQHPYNIAFTRILRAGQYRGAYKMGLHLGRFPALVQAGAPVDALLNTATSKVFTTNNPAYLTGYYGINIHPRQALGASSNRVGKASAACQVPRYKADMDEILRLAAIHAARYGNSFDYTLLEVPVAALIAAKSSAHSTRHV